MKWFYRSGTEYEGDTTKFEGDQQSFTRTIKCPKCGGQGGSEHWNRTGWTCYKCGGDGKGVEAVKLYTQEKLNKLNAQAEKHQIKKDALQEAKVTQVWDKLKTFHLQAWEILKQVKNSFNAKMVDVLDAGKYLTENQINTILRVDKQNKEKTQKETQFEGSKNVPTGRLEVIGLLLSTKVVTSEYGESYRGLFLCKGGFRIWGTLPRGTCMEDRGMVFKFKATFEGPSVDDAQFGFYKRPSQCEVVEQ